MTDAPDEDVDPGGNITALVVEARRLAEGVDTRARDRKWIIGLLSLIVVLILGLIGTVGLSWRAANHRATSAASERARTAEAVRHIGRIASTTKRVTAHLDDCLTETGRCFQRQQARTDTIVGVPKGPINTVNLYMTACAQNHVGEDAILKCVEHKLKARAASASR